MALLVKGLGLFNDAYQLFVMNIVNVILEKEYPNEYTDNKESLVSTSVFVGAVLGQVIVGYLADSLGRRGMMIISCSLLIIGGLLCSFIYGGSANVSIWLLIICRGILGFGIGAEYPLAATSSSESSGNTNENMDAIAMQKQKNTNVALVFSLQGIGQLMAALVGNIVIQILCLHTPYDKKNLDLTWRLLFFIGTIPAISIFYFRWNAKESATFANNSKNLKSLNLNFGQKIKIIFKHYLIPLIGTCGSWFLFDVVFYAQSIFSDTIMNSITHNDDSNDGDDNDKYDLLTTSLKNVILALGAIPGYFAAVIFINKIGRRNMQIQGFLNMGILFFVIGFCWDYVKNHAILFIILYALTFFFSNFGPNTTTFVLPVEIFPTLIRATCHGFAAASGKIGATVGAALFDLVSDQYGDSATFIICAAISWLGALLTVFTVYDGPSDPDDLDQAFNAVLSKDYRLNTQIVRSGYVTMQEEDDDQTIDNNLTVDTNIINES